MDGSVLPPPSQVVSKLLKLAPLYQADPLQSDPLSSTLFSSEMLHLLHV